MMETAPLRAEATPLDPGLRALCGIAAYYRIAADPVQLARELALTGRAADESDLVRAARMVGLKARLVGKVTAERLATLPVPAIPEPDASAIEGDPARGSSAEGFAGAERTQNLVFPVVLRPDAATIMVDGVAEPLTSGMAVTVELKTGHRRVLEYLFAPLFEVASKAMRER